MLFRRLRETLLLAQFVLLTKNIKNLVLNFINKCLFENRNNHSKAWKRFSSHASVNHKNILKQKNIKNNTEYPHIPSANDFRQYKFVKRSSTDFLSLPDSTAANSVMAFLFVTTFYLFSILFYSMSHCLSFGRTEG